MIIYSLKVAEIREETSDSKTICFKQPGLKKVKYQSGQYLSLIFRINGRRFVRPYSFSSAPVIDPYLEVTVKRVPGGVVSNHIFDQVKIGDVVEVMQPMGDFIVSDQMLASNFHFVFWGAGSGITPLFSIAKYILSLNRGHKVTLVYGNRNYESVIFLKKIRRLHVDYPDLFSVWHFHTQVVVEDDHPYLVQGRIQPERVLSIMQKEGDISNSYHYICGPVGLKESVKTSLEFLNVPPENIFSEDFEVVRDEKDFEDVVTRNLNLIKDGKTIPLEVVKGKSILEAGLDAMVDINYSCQTGNCLVCKGKITSGEVKHIGLKKLPEGLQEGECLLCCSYPLTEGVEVSIL